MKRSMFLDLCVQAAVKRDKPKVLYAGIEYYPEGHNCLVYCPLAKVEEVEA